MWAIKILNGPHAGQIYELKSGKNTIGRAPECDIQITEPGISKEHATINVLSEKIFITDLKSSNGTFLNGLKIQNSLLKPNDKFSLHNTLFDFVAIEIKKVMVQQQNKFEYIENETSEQVNEQVSLAVPNNNSAVINFKDPQKTVDDFLNKKALPGVYRLIEYFDFKTIFFAFGAIFILIVTLLSIIPMKMITEESILTESKRRSITVARAMAAANEKMIRSQDVTQYSTDLIIKEEGITEVYIVGKDGQIIAPAERTGDYPKQTGFMQKLKKVQTEFADKISADQVGAAVPILKYDSQLQQNVAQAYVVVVYNVAQLSYDDGRAFSLFIQTLTLALILGFILFYFLYKLIEYPYINLTQNLDHAIKEGQTLAQNKMRWSIIDNLLVSINSLLNRTHSEKMSSSPHIDLRQLEREYAEIIKFFGFPALLIDRNLTILATNQTFIQLLGFSEENLIGKSCDKLPDQALQKNILDLIERTKNHLHSYHSDKLEISGNNFNLHCQSYYLIDHLPYFFIVSISPDENSMGGAA